MSNQLCVQATIHGTVQGVGFRAWTEKNATQRGLTGWVRNRTDGTVEAVLCGEEQEVEALMEDFRCGPPGARVSRVERKMPDAPPPADFKTLATE